ncbi:MAG: tRNA nucleotidyltransferase, partial [Bacteroidetes bacterium]|nr:tRNA nucleotidyltransferase [Bacteroidota bacterium]
MLEIVCTKEERQLLELVAEAAAAQNIACYAIGGFVRDKLLHRKSKDIDIVCAGNGIDLAHAVADQCHPRPKVSFFKNFGTAHFHFRNFDVEFVGARKESYAAHTRKPEVSQGSLEEDQQRRDFTINAMAIDLRASNFGKLVDPFNG